MIGNTQIPPQAGKICVITGANSGVGFATARVLAEMGAKVIMACRDTARGSAALNTIRQSCPDTEARVEQLDLGALSSIRAFADRLSRVESRVDILINNAGIMVPPLEFTDDGFESQFGINFLGHFVLTGQLFKLLESATAGRVVTLSSVAHWYGRIRFDNLNAERGYSKVAAYGQSKLADLVYAYELDRRLKKLRAKTISIGAHPGLSSSNLARNDWKSRLAMALLGQTAEAGALPSLLAATSPNIKGGEYVGPSGWLTLTGAPEVQRSSRRSTDIATGEQLWLHAERLTKEAYLS